MLVELPKLIGQEIHWPTETLTLCTDASDLAFGATLFDAMIQNETLDVSDWLPNNIINESSTFRELYAIQQSLERLKVMLARGQYKRLTIKTDSQAAYWILRKGFSKKPYLYNIANEIFLLMLQLGIHWSIQWIPRDLNSMSMRIIYQNALTRMTG